MMQGERMDFKAHRLKPIATGCDERSTGGDSERCEQTVAALRFFASNQRTVQIFSNETRE
jgi:hypothetical protein